MEPAVHFSIKYDGSALENHTMDVRDLAPALIALSDVFEEANRALFHDASKVVVNVRGNFKSGSFLVDLIAQIPVFKQITGILTGETATAASNILGILSALGLLGGGTGLIALIKWIRGRKATSRIEGEHVIFMIEEEDIQESYSVDLNVGKLYQNRVIRKFLAKVVKPLENDGIDVFSCGRDGETHSVIEKADLHSFEAAADASDIVSDSINENILIQIESAVFKDGNKWRFTDGDSTFYAEITDRDFLERINSGEERFGKNDVMIVNLRRIQSVTDAGLKQEYQVLRVHEHRERLQRNLVFMPKE